MGQCLPCLVYGDQKVRELKFSKVDSHQVSKDHLDRAFTAFRTAGAAASAHQEAWEHAYSIVVALVEGAFSHVPEAFKSVEFICSTECKSSCKCLPSGGDGVVAALKVHFWPSEILGEIATRSRVSVTMRLAQEVCFALQQPPSDLTLEPLILEIAGLDFPCLEEAKAMRSKLKAELGDKYCMQTAFEYFEQIKHKDCLAHDSKLRRIHASLFEVASFVKPPAWVCSKSFYGHLNAPSNVFEALEFWDEGSSGIRVTSRKAPPPNEDESQCVAISESIVLDLLKSEVDDRVARKFFKSAYNFGCLNFARANGFPGAQPQLIAKLFSAAHMWGPASSGWQSYDNTWLCTDTKNSFGAAQEQGRVIWITPGAAGIPRVPADRTRGGLRANVVSGSESSPSPSVNKYTTSASISFPPLTLTIILAIFLVAMSWLKDLSPRVTVHPSLR
eukprot:TRINITY_DN76976_c0_g1_i1.p1 TRINITY_DN76976_c0_g1~~TRINITY_DN76976_c0_g1_i1.p1  ORF type:complete len:445 (-),score=58.49 TRINITY_DN76976_c0_g1_i1:44-1378(-)